MPNTLTTIKLVKGAESVVCNLSDRKAWEDLGYSEKPAQPEKEVLDQPEKDEKSPKSQNKKR